MVTQQALLPIKPANQLWNNLVNQTLMNEDMTNLVLRFFTIVFKLTTKYYIPIDLVAQKDISDAHVVYCLHGTMGIWFKFDWIGLYQVFSSENRKNFQMMLSHLSFREHMGRQFVLFLIVNFQSEVLLASIFKEYLGCILYFNISWLQGHWRYPAVSIKTYENFANVLDL